MLLSLAGLAATAACAGAQEPARVTKDAPSGNGANGAALPLKHAPRPTAAPISAADLMTRLYIFADDSMMGREAGTVGNMKGNAYIERELRRLGLRPAGENGTYFQTVPYVRRAVDQNATLTVGGETLRYGTDFLASPGAGTPRSIDGAGVVFGGALGTEGLPGLTLEAANGKIVVVNAPSLAAVRQLGAVPALRGAAGVALVLLDQMPPQFRAQLNRVQFVVDSAAFAAGGAPAGPGNVPTVLVVSRRAAQARLGAAPDSAAVGTAGRTVAGNVAFRTERAPAQNVVAILPGSDARLSGTYVGLGAHNDHVGMAPAPVDHDSLKAFNAAARRFYMALDPVGGETLANEAEQTYRQQRQGIRVNVDSLRALRPARPDSVFNGADDDGSGSMALLEIAENLVTSREKPKRSLLFVWHTAEEKGLVGARWFVDHPTVPRDSIVAQLNIDMIGRGTANDVATGGPNYVGIVGHRRLSTQLGDLAEAVAKAQANPIKLDFALDANGHPQNIYCRSDHFHYARYGIPIAFFFTGLHGDYHQLTDEPQYIDYPHYARITNYVRDLALRVANLDQRPVVDKPKPDPTGACRQ
ncbi:MAG: M28 family metallopeptidase [Gemmatirosa sp.]